MRLALFAPGDLEPWYLQGGVAKGNCVAAYKAAGAPSLAASYINLVTPGTYNLSSVGGDPTLDAAQGWNFAGNRYLTTGITPLLGWTAIINFTQANTAASNYVFGVRASNYFAFYTNTTTIQWCNRIASVRTYAGNGCPANGILGLAPAKLYFNGDLVDSTTVSDQTYGPMVIGGLHRTGVGIVGYYTGYISHFAIYNTELSANQIKLIGNAMALGVNFFMPYGDSNSDTNDTWPGLITAGRPKLIEYPLRTAVSGRTTAAAWAAVASDFTGKVGTPGYILYNLGVNDALNWGVEGNEPVWKGHTLDIWSYMHNKWPLAKIYVMYPWCAGQDANCDTLAGWFDTCRTTAPYSGYVLVGPDERVWKKGSDNGGTMCTDGTHYSAAGQAELAAQWLAKIPA